MTETNSTPATEASATPATPDASPAAPVQVGEVGSDGQTKLSTAEIMYGDTAQGGEATVSGDTASGGQDTTPGGQDTAQGGNDTTPSGQDTTPGDNDTTEGGEDSTEGGEDSTEGGDNAEYQPFAIPEEIPADPQDITALTAFGKKHNLSQEALQEIVNMQIDITKRSYEQFENTKDQRQTALEDHPDLGGENLTATMNKGNAVMSKFSNAGLIDTIVNHGLAYDPDLADFLSKVYDATSEDQIGDGSGGGGTEQKLSHAEILYGNIHNPKQ